MQATSARISQQGEWATWVSHGVLMSATVETSNLVLGDPWYGYAAGLGGTLMWEASEHHERAKRNVPQAPSWTTAVDIIVPVAVGFLLSEMLDDDEETVAEEVAEEQERTRIEPDVAPLPSVDPGGEGSTGVDQPSTPR